jgi:transposase
MGREVILSTADREYLQGILSKGKHAARKIKRVRVLLLLSQGATAEEVADKSGAALSTVYKIGNRYLEEGRDAEGAVTEKPRPGQPPKLTDTVKAHITAVACSSPPEGRSQWSLKMIADRVVELGCVEAISAEAVRRCLKKSSSSPGRRSAGSSGR